MIACEHAIASAGAAIADGLALRDSLPPRQAAELAWTPTGPSVDELEARIRASRETPIAAHKLAITVPTPAVRGRRVRAKDAA